ncbi:hypothetical protein Tco_1235089 [Tanacetum coccineum]
MSSDVGIDLINGLKQGGLSMPNYYHKLNSLWKEFDTLTLLPSCTCAAHKGSNILSKDPLPDVKDAFSVVSREESRRGLHPGSLSGSKVQLAAFVFKSNSFKSNDFKRNSDNTNRGKTFNGSAKHPPYKFKWAKRTIPVAEGSSETTTEGYMENYKNVLEDIKNLLNAKVEVVHIILTGIDNYIYSTVDACPNAMEMWKAIKILKQNESINVQDLETNLFGNMESSPHRMVNHLNRITQEWQRFVTLVKQSQELNIVSYHKLYDILKQHQNKVNEIKVERPAHTANPLALVAQQQPVYHSQSHPTHYTQNSSTRSQQAATRNRGKVIVNSLPPIYDQEPDVVTKDDAFRANHDNNLRINKGTGYDNQRAVNVAGARENVDYHKEKMILCKQEEAGVQLNSEQVDWRDDTDDEHEDQELEAHYLNITTDSVDMSTNREEADQDDDDLARECDLLDSLIEKLKCEIDFQAKLDRYHDVNYASKVEIECAKAKGELILHKMSSEKSFNEYTRKINDLNQMISKMKKEIIAHQESISIMSQEKEAQKKFYKTHEDKELKKVIALENKIKVLDDIVYKTGQSVQTMNMLNRNCKTSFVKPEFLKKAQRANPRLYDIGCYNDNLALMLAPESDETIRLAQ